MIQLELDFAMLSVESEDGATRLGDKMCLIEGKDIAILSGLLDAFDRFDILCRRRKE